ncbi:hypothetical protein [Asticcacaulis sp. AC402]|uniref:DUF6898 family protein n=1 Tax=Asticcacaulis sp. AC402 TaxID=1282361 RepID=UPI0003C3EFE8|nr:hypothetical protein [Asticcacaulis sp. AC402]ESQ75357.1 hypothetical protein ABAC402_09640 [Asticcacaulis sp. AC402]
MSEIYLELLRNGNFLKCTAVDAATGEEAIAIGPLNYPEGVKRLAIQKLRNKLSGRRPPPKPGIIV